ncbi:MAG: hypothetical protein JNK05_00415 [Myxococcales bacterium]|nr:hypothetical protein [Myxococcales bacterium]
MAELVRVIYRDEGCATAVYRNVMIAYFRGPANLTRMRGFRATQRELAKHADPVGCVIVSDLHETAKMDLDEETRREIQHAMTAYNDRDLAVAVAVEVQGFIGTAVRALVSGLMLLARPKYPMKILGNRHEAARWLLEKIRGGQPAFTPDELGDAIAATRDAITPP